MNPAGRQRCSEALERARRTAIPVSPLTDAEPELPLEDAYAIAQLGVAARLADGARLTGHKIGLTSTAVQAQLGVDQPDYGALLDDMEVPASGTVAAGRLLAPRVELEFAFRLRAPLEGPGVTDADVVAATAALQPAIEIVDSRIADWRITLADTVADNASSGAYVLGGESFALEALDPEATEVSLSVDGEVRETGRAAAVLGHPVRAVTWLANALGAFGTRLEAGQVILSGACTRMVDARPGEAFRGDFGPFGTVEVTFAKAAA